MEPTDDCTEADHDTLRAAPALLLRLRPWGDEIDLMIGECPRCGSTLGAVGGNRLGRG